MPRICAKYPIEVEIEDFQQLDLIVSGLNHRLENTRSRCCFNRTLLGASGVASIFFGLSTIPAIIVSFIGNTIGIMYKNSRR